MTRISIFGSCVTRETFNQAPALVQALVSYHARTSIASVMSLPISFDLPESVPGVKPFELRCIRADLDKSCFATLAGARPDVLVMDMIDERHPLQEHDGRYFSFNPLFKHIPALQDFCAAGRSIPKASGEAMLLWQAACTRFLAQLRAAHPHLRIIFIDARFALAARDAAGAVHPLQGRQLEWAHNMNMMLGQMRDFCARHLPDAILIAPAPAATLADANHRFGQTPFHYVPEWYEDVAQQIIAAAAVPQDA